jgi:UPF0755 protein
MWGEREMMLKKVASAAVILAFIGFCLVSAVGLELIGYARQPADPGAADKVVGIVSGQSMAQTAAILERLGIIRGPLKFRVLARLYGEDRRIQAGEYSLSGSLAPREILDILVGGRVRRHRITIAEGLTVAQIAALVESSGLASAEAFQAAATDPAALAAAGIEADSFEGYLFPETYFFTRSDTAADMAAAMAARFRQVFRPEWHRRAAEMGWTVHQVVTLASIVEKETGAARERALISGVFHNRLRRGMRLESDPTVIYGIADFDGDITRHHLRTSTPYNTYRIFGLPPGPIANPGAAAIEAALFPEETDALYFVSRNDGTHVFSGTYAEHLKAVRRYQSGQ